MFKTIFSFILTLILAIVLFGLVAKTEGIEIKAFYSNEETQEWEVIENSAFGQSKGISSTITTHFSTYDVYEDTPTIEVISAVVQTADITSNEENELPDTGTNMYSLLICSLLIIAGGLLAFFIQWKIGPKN